MDWIETSSTPTHMVPFHALELGALLDGLHKNSLQCVLDLEWYIFFCFCFSTFDILFLTSSLLDEIWGKLANLKVSRVFPESKIYDIGGRCMMFPLFLLLLIFTVLYLVCTVLLYKYIYLSFMFFYNDIHLLIIFQNFVRYGMSSPTKK